MEPNGHQNTLAVKPEAALFGAQDPVAAVEQATRIATTLAGLLKRRRLVLSIQGRQMLTLEGWSVLATAFGLCPVVSWARAIQGKDGETIGFEARAEVMTRDGRIVGGAEGQCDRSEKAWNSRDSHALKGMAQSRAVTRALRGTLGFVLSLAGLDIAEDNEPGAGLPPRAPSRPASRPPSHQEAKASPGQIKRFWSILNASGVRSREEAVAYLKARGYESSEDILRRDYESCVNWASGNDEQAAPAREVVHAA